MSGGVEGLRKLFNRINRRLEESNMPIGHALARSWESDLHRLLIDSASVDVKMDNDLIERLRKLRDCAEETDDAEIVDDDPRCVFVPMLPEDFDALLREAADALEAARADAGRLDWLDAQRGNDVQGSYPEEPQLVGHYWSIDGQCTDVRTAIDAAMAAEGRDG